MKILLATDGSECSDAAVGEVARRPWPADTQVRVISVVEPPAPLVAEPYMIDADYFKQAERVKRRAKLRLAGEISPPHIKPSHESARKSSAHTLPLRTYVGRSEDFRLQAKRVL